jgi:hypothetical protein
VRDLVTVNRSLILHVAWNVATGKNAFLTAILKAKYFPNTSFWSAGNNSTKSVFWSSVMQVKDIIVNNCIIQIQKGNSSIWSTPWCSIWKEIHNHLNLPVTVQNLPQKISDLWTPGSMNWNADFINEVFDSDATTAIQNTPVVPSDCNDVVKWRPSSKGSCSTKEAFRFLNKDLQVQLPTNGARSITGEAMEILRKVWKHKLIPPNIKTFAWRLIRRAIATGARAGSLSSKIDKNCDSCSMIENDSHLFFRCSFARAVWFSARPPLRSSMLPFEQDGVQEALAALITRTTSDADLHRIWTTLWYIWKARNDIRFNRKKWTVWQVHHAVQTDIEIASSYNNTCEDTGITVVDPSKGNKILLQVQNSHSAGTLQQGGRAEGIQRHEDFQMGLPSNDITCRLPVMPLGAKCYTDASLTTDIGEQQPRMAGIGIFIIDPARRHKFFIKAQVKRSTSVLMAEAAAMATAATIIRLLNMNVVSFLTDNRSSEFLQWG